MDTIKNNDFIEIEYTGMLAEDKFVFDSTDEALAKKSAIYSAGQRYGPVVICVGEGQILKGLDNMLIGKEIGKSYTFNLTPEQGFGKKDPKLFKLVPSGMFVKQKINPQPGLQVEIDGVVGTIRTVTGGRVIVDFNHPFSGRDLIYNVNVKSVVTDKAKQTESLIRMLLNMPAEVSVEADAATITMDMELPAEFATELEKRIVELVKVKSAAFKVKEKKAAPKKE